ncbi:MAG TPA: response regulator transcription factor [Clostridiales bacterium]|nr:response regulator transcription factor [Clostridiales bacterium]
MDKKPLILVIDDDKNIAEVIRLYLLKEQYDVVVAHDGREGIEMFKNKTPDLVLLDIMLPVMDGWEVCKKLRSISNTPIIMLTAKDETIDKVLGLELGADDYVVKPFEPKELVARIKAVLRRYSKGMHNKEKEVAYKNLFISLETYTVTYNSKDISLPPKEIELLFFLASHPNKVFTRDQLLEQVWGYEFTGDSRTVDVHINRLREKFNHPENSWEIKTVWGVGYRFEVK